MRRSQKILAGAIAAWFVLSFGFLGYGWYTRQGAPEFSQGGSFGSETESTVPGSKVKKAARAKAVAEEKEQRATVAAERRTPTGQTPVVQGPDALPLPYARLGAYAYDGDGRERVTFGGASPCSWEIEDVSLDVKRDGDSRVFDWTYSDERVERHVVGYEPTGIYTEFVGSAVTCVGVRRTSEDRYTPPALRMALPLKVGDSWRDSTQVKERREDVRGEILRTERITVPAGTFRVYVVQIDVQLSGSEEGEFTTTRWFSPDLGVSVKEIAHTDIVSGSAHFVSDMELRLARTP